MASLKIAHFWGNLLAWGYETIFQYYGSIDPLLMGGCYPQRRLPNVKVLLRWPSIMHIYGSVGPFHLMEVPTTRLPNVKMLLRWPSRMHIYCFVEIALYLCTMHLLLIWSLLWGMESRHRAKPLMFALANINQLCSEGMGIPMP